MDTEQRAVSTQERLHGFDRLRFWAILAVVCIHSSDVALRKNNYFPVSSGEGDLYIVFNACLRFCVPVLLMMSAFLLERSRQETGKNPQARWPRYLFPLGVASIFYTLITLFQARLTHHPVQGGMLLLLFVTGRAYYHTYFLFNLLCYVLLHNLLRRLVKPPLFYALMGFSVLVFAGLEWVLGNWRSGWSPFGVDQSLFWEFLIGMLPYYVLGLWAADNLARIRAWPLASIQMVILAGLALCCIYGVVWHLSSFFTPGALILATGLFCVALRVKRPPLPAMARIGSLSLGIYLWHPFVLVLLRIAEGRLYREAVSPALTFGIMLMEIGVAFAGSFLIASGLARLPALRGLAQ